ncbi:YqgE/AlgH family protein [Bremerella sp. JC770]|uniref:YqgE/AlgH family protein n=1 Tax=Bremerella sp. JC770 TaxID=3232137 RepID=UPI003458A60E
MQSLAGHFLIASPYLPDPNFLRTVVLMVQHDEEGALGLVLTRPINLTVQEIWKNVSGENIDAPENVLQGGPVEGPLMALHQEEKVAEMEVIPGVYFSSQRENIEPLIRESRNDFRLFLGYSGWGSQQLEAEMEVGGWLTLPAKKEQVFETDNDILWKSVSGEVGSNIMRDSLNLKRMPQDPNVN